MQCLTGKGIVKGVATGRIFFYDREKVTRKKIDNVDAEIGRYKAAKTKAAEQLEKLYEKALAEVGRENANVFEAHRMILEDEGYTESVSNIIRTEKVCAEYAVEITCGIVAEKFAGMDDESLKARSADIKDVSERLTGILSGRKNVPDPEEPVILVAEELTPSETLIIDRSKLLAFATRSGSADSHTSVFARALGLPYVAGVEIDRSWNGKQAIIDGHEGTVTIDPDADQMNKALTICKRDEEHRKALRKFKGKPCVTKSGRTVRLCANISGVGDIDTALDNDAEGIGLFRSEFLYMESRDWPTEDKQFQIYKTVVQRMAGRKVVIRTFDLGADKQADYLDPGREENPALGFRGIRICLARPEIFRTQLRAIYRASAYGNVAVMFPMITSVDEVQQCRKFVDEVKQELRDENIPFSDEVETGIMIETPAAALISESLAKEVDFFSIGTNDLIQYTLAADRQNAKLEAVRNPHHPAVLELIRMTVGNGHKCGIRVGICGELAADTSLTAGFIGYGADELSVSPEFILPLKKEIMKIE